MKYVMLTFGVAASVMSASSAIAADKLNFTCQLPTATGADGGKFVQVISSDDEHQHPRYVYQREYGSKLETCVTFPNNPKSEKLAQEAMLLNWDVILTAKKNGAVEKIAIYSKNDLNLNCSAPNQSVNLDDTYITKAIDRNDWNGRWYVLESTKKSTKPYCVTFRDSPEREKLAHYAMLLGQKITISAAPGGLATFLSY